MAKVRCTVDVSGDVQGVGYRYSCGQTARILGVAGSAANLPDGSVRCVFEGDAAAVEQMLQWARHGPRHARVERISVDYGEPHGLVGFETG